MEAFWDCVTDCELEDLGFSGSLFTWYNNCEGDQRILKRIYHALANSLWGDLFPNMCVVHGLDAYSDHCPLWVDTNGIPPRRRGPKKFHFEAMWVREKGWAEIIDQVWNTRNGDCELKDIMNLIGECGSHLKLWNRDCFGNSQRRLNEAKAHLK